MQGKGIVVTFLIVMTLVCLRQYMFILPASAVESAAQSQSEEEASKVPVGQQDAVQKAVYSAYLDSMSNEVVNEFGSFGSTYQELKAQQLQMGLDLKGGMSVVLQVDLREFIEKLANDPEYEPLKKALDLADENLKSAQSDYITLFADAWTQTSEGQSLRDLFRRNEVLKDDINTSSSDGQIISLLREKANETVADTHDMLKKRIDKLGVVQPNISLDAARDLILVELPGIDNPERARAFLQSAAKLEFWNVYRASDNNFVNFLITANDRLKLTEKTKAAERVIESTTEIYAKDSLGNDIKDQLLRIDTSYVGGNNPLNDGPLLSILSLNRGATPMIGYASRYNKAKVDEYLKRDDIAGLFPKDVKWLWSRSAEQTTDAEGNVEEGAESLYTLYAIKKSRGKIEAPLTGGVVVDATASPNETGQMEVTLRMNQEGARTWGRLTTAAAQDANNSIAIVLDDEVVSAPRVNGPITGGVSSITGNFSIQEAKDLAQFLKVGRLPAETRIIQESIVGPTLGAKNIQSSIWSLVGGFGLVFLFMLFYYGSAGFVSIICLLLNLFFIFGALASLNAVLTLPGVAGIVLTVGMAVDANVIIYERIREELRDGKTLRAAVADGFSNSYSAIIDANVTTFAVAAVLAYFGLGPIKGFAVVLMIGVLSSVFTAVLVARLIIEWWLDRGNELTFWTGASKNAFANMNIDWLGKRKVAYAISTAIIVLGLGSMFTKGFDLGVDFKGGYSYNVEFAQDTDVDALRESLSVSLGDATVKEAGNTNTYSIVTSYKAESNEEGAQDLVLAKLYEGIKAVDSGVTLEQLKNSSAEGATHITSSSKVGPTIADDIQKSAFIAAVIALLFIFLYIFLRFNKWQYSAGAVAALFHDTLIVLSIFSIFYGLFPFAMEIDQAFIAAILTVIGYSINDTVVVFDRIREYLNLYTGEDKESIINKAVNSTVSRTVITSLTTLFVVLMLFIFGGGSIKGFAFALLVGIIVGTYSSIFVATPIMSDLTGKLEAKKTVKKSKSSFSRATRNDAP